MTQAHPSASAPPQPSLHLDGPEATTEFAQWFAPSLKAGDVLLLDGPIGAGKTHFARALITARRAAAGASPEDVPSPTYTLVQTYDAGDVEIWHADLYRLTHPDEIAELGLEAAFDTVLCLVEWPDRLGSLVPAEALTLQFGVIENGDARSITLSGKGARAQALAIAARDWWVGHE